MAQSATVPEQLKAEGRFKPSQAKYTLTTLAEAPVAAVDVKADESNTSIQMEAIEAIDTAHGDELTVTTGLPSS